MIGKFLVDSLFASVIPPHRVDVSLDLFEEGLSSSFWPHKRHASFCRGSRHCEKRKVMTHFTQQTH